MQWWSETYGVLLMLLRDEHTAPSSDSRVSRDVLQRHDVRTTHDELASNGVAYHMDGLFSP